MPISARELLRTLSNLGFDGPEAGGRHLIMIKGQLRLAVPNPHGSKEIDDPLLRRILRQAGITKEDFERARKKKR